MRGYSADVTYVDEAGYLDMKKLLEDMDNFLYPFEQCYKREITNWRQYFNDA